MTLPPLRSRSSCGSALLLFALLVGCNDDEPCQANVKKIERCNRRFRADICDSKESQCYVDCYAKASCNDFFAIDEGRTPAWLSQCTFPCLERFECGSGETVLMRWQCDGSEDCVDGSDEIRPDGGRCSYFKCDDGQLVSTDARCDESVQCGDESDEKGCS